MLVTLTKMYIKLDANASLGLMFQIAFNSLKAKVDIIQKPVN